MSSTIKIAIVGVGNCASALIQGLEYYKNVDKTSTKVPGLMHPILGGYLVRDIQIVAAFDVNANKIGKDVAEAIWIAPNNAKRFSNVPPTGVTVSPGHLGDGIAPHMRELIPTRDGANDVDIVGVLKKSGAEILVSFLPVGSHHASRFYAHACIDAGVAFINGIPEFIASDPEWAEKFRLAGIPCAGDDVMSQLGATILNRVLINLVKERGHAFEHSSQFNDGGNADFNNMQDPARVESKRISKTESLKFEAGTDDGIIARPAFYDHTLGDHKIASIVIEGRQFGDMPFTLNVKLSVEDSPNDAGVMVDVIRLMKLSLDRGLCGYQEWSAYYFKHPLEIKPLPDARALVEKFAADVK